MAFLSKKTRGEARKMRAHLIGIKGVGMTGLAEILRARGFLVSGSDTHEKFFTDEVLKRLRIPVHEGFAARNIPKGVELVIASAAYFQNLKSQISNLKSANPEVREARRRGIPILTYPEAVGELFNDAYGIAVAGSHGKSTTSAFLAVTLEKLGFDPSAIIGTRVNNWGTNARAAQQRHGSRRFADTFVLEADEYRETFLRYAPKEIVLTNIDWDHPDYFKTPRSYTRAFEKLLKRIPRASFVVANGDDARILQILKSKAQNPKNKKNPKLKIQTLSTLLYGFGKENSLKILRYSLHKDGMRFLLSYRGRDLGVFRTRLYGEHNVMNAAAVVGACLALGVPAAKIRAALPVFTGTARRMEFLTALRPERKFVVIDDYAHHPTEIRATLNTVRQIFPRGRLVVVFQPHTYSRTQVLLQDFARSFGDADEVIIVETYASAREKGDKKLAQKLAVAVARHHSATQYARSISAATRLLIRSLTPSLPRSLAQTVVVTLGAGDVWRVGKSFVDR